MPQFYVEPGRRFHLGWFDRNERLTPLHKIVAPDLERLPRQIQDAMLEEFVEKHSRFLDEPSRRPRAWLQETTESLLRARLSLGFDTEEIDTRAHKLAKLSSQLGSFRVIKHMAAWFDLEPPAGTPESTPETLARRCYEPRTWRRIIEKNYTRKAENHLRSIGFVQKADQLYCSDLAVNWYQGKMRAQEAYLKSRTVSDGTTQLELWDVVQKSISNKSIRRTELMTRMRGLEDYSKEQDHVATFATLTCPSAYHARHIGGGSNLLFEGGTVRDAQRWLSRIWARARAQLHKLNVEIYGMRVAEPHHDGTPHWHMVLFCAANHRGTLCDVLKSKWLSEHAGEPGADEHRATFKNIESAKGSATGYLSKYIAKNIDAYEVGEDFEQPGTQAVDSINRVTAWASIHGIRQFQQIGKRCAGVTLYRECRRVRTHSGTTGIERMRAAADEHDYGGFIRLAEQLPLSLWKQGGVSVDKATGEIVAEKNAYGEVRPPKIVGVETLTERMRTRLKTWRIQRKWVTNSPSGSAWRPSSSASLSSSSPLPILNSALGPVSITVPGAVSLSDPHGWTNPNETSMYGPN